MDAGTARAPGSGPGTHTNGVGPMPVYEYVCHKCDSRFDLLRPIYAKTAAHGHFGREDHDFTWEKTDKAAALRDAAGLAVEARA